MLLTNAMIVDGSGAQPSKGSLLIVDGMIAEVGEFDAPRDVETLDLAGQAVAPGFIDLHSHSDLKVLEDRVEKSLQGVTLEVVGNCGFSPYPCGNHAHLVGEQNRGILHGAATWAGAADYLADARSRSSLVQVESLIGHGTLRSAVCGTRAGALDTGDLRAMETELERALAEGAVGFSTGLMYAPGSEAPFDELERLCRIVARAGKLYTSHMRSYSWTLVEALDEQIELARRTGCRLQISHLQAVGRANWPKQQQALEKIEQAHAQGIDIAFDCYPYLAGSTVMTQLLPQSSLAAGLSDLLGRLHDPVSRASLIGFLNAETAQAWSDIFISALATDENKHLVGKDLASIAAGRNRGPAETVLDLLAEEQGQVNILSFNQSEPNLRELLTHPLGSVISDGFYVDGRPHPRLYATFPLFLGHFCRERKWLSLADAVHKITQAPARRLLIGQRAALVPGSPADLVVFDPQSIGTAASYEAPAQYPCGISLVLRRGKVVQSASSIMDGRASQSRNVALDVLH